MGPKRGAMCIIYDWCIVMLSGRYLDNNCIRISMRKYLFFFKKMGQSRPLFLFSFISHYNFNTNWIKHRWCAWDSNPQLQNGRRRQNHGAMAATLKYLFLLTMSAITSIELKLVVGCAIRFVLILERRPFDSKVIY